MKKILIIPDSFKETLSSFDAGEIISSTIKSKYKNVECINIPIADGGEGSVLAICNNDASKLFSTEVVDANGNEKNVDYGKLDNDVYIIEVASVVGFDSKEEFSTPANTTTYGVGQLISKILEKNPKEINICLGGTITNDAGCGMAAALGVEFFDKDDQLFIPRGETLKDISYIDATNIDKRISNVVIKGLCDVNNPLYGKDGASFVYAMQKGADEEMVKSLDDGLIHLSQVVKECLGKANENISGAGAAGGLGYGLITFLDGRLVNGISTILDLSKANEYINDCDILITGEGKLDNQSFSGKVISGIMKLVDVNKTRVIIIVGKKNIDDAVLEKNGIKEVYETNVEDYPMEIVKVKCKEQLKNAVLKIEI